MGDILSFDHPENCAINEKRIAFSRPGPFLQGRVVLFMGGEEILVLMNDEMMIKTLNCHCCHQTSPSESGLAGSPNCSRPPRETFKLEWYYIHKMCLHQVKGNSLAHNKCHWCQDVLFLPTSSPHYFAHIPNLKFAKIPFEYACKVILSSVKYIELQPLHH